MLDGALSVTFPWVCFFVPSAIGWLVAKKRRHLFLESILGYISVVLLIVAALWLVVIAIILAGGW